jgi:hypothetical protein
MPDRVISLTEEVAEVGLPMMLDQRKMVEYLVRNGVPLNTASGLIER